MTIERVLLLSMGFGMGHNTTALTLKNEFLKIEGVEAEIIDLLELAPAFFNPFFQSGYSSMLNRFPFFYHCLYDWTNQSRMFRYISSECIELMGLMIRKKLNVVLDEFQPTRIVSTHPFALLLCPAKWLEVPTVGVVTDYELHPIWLARVPNILCVPKGLLIQNQLEKIQQKTGLELCETGFPVSAEFYQPLTQEEARARLGLDKRPVVLVMGGGTGLGPMEEIVRDLEPYSHIQVVVLTGKNPCLYERLKAQNYGPHIRIEAFRSDVATWMSASDLLVTKSGGVTINEAIAKRLPMFLFEAFRGQEQANQQYLIHYGIAVVTHPATTGTQIEDFLSNTRHGVQERFSSLRAPDAVSRIVEKTLTAVNPKYKNL